MYLTFLLADGITFYMIHSIINPLEAFWKVNWIQVVLVVDQCPFEYETLFIFKNQFLYAAIVHNSVSDLRIFVLLLMNDVILQVHQTQCFCHTSPGLITTHTQKSVH